MNLKELLETMVARDASDLHIKPGSPPGIRVHGDLEPIDSAWDPLTPEDTSALIDELLDEDRRATYEKNRQLDFSTYLAGIARFRVNVFHQRESRAAVLRLIPMEVPKLESLGFPDIVKKLCKKPRGLVLVTGPTGSGKSTTLAAMIDFINRTEKAHILTLEDPIEFMHNDKSCYVNQREIGSDALNFSDALRAALREDPDIILVGEMRDLETIGLAVTAAETGHLVFGTLHTTSAIQTVDRVIDVFPHEAQQQIRAQLANTIQGVVSQTLVSKIGGGRACAQEVMIGTGAVRNCIREGKTPQLLNMIQTGAQYGMHTLEANLETLVLEGKIEPEIALGKANLPAALASSLAKAGIKLQEAAPPAPPAKKPISTQNLAERFSKATGGAEPKPNPNPAKPEKQPEKQPEMPAVVDDFEKFRAMQKER